MSSKENKAVDLGSQKTPETATVFGQASELGNAARRNPDASASSATVPGAPQGRTPPPIPETPLIPKEERPRTTEEEDLLKQAYATIRRLERHSPITIDGVSSRVLKKYRVLLFGVTKGKSNNSPAGIDLEKYNEKESTVMAYDESQAWDIFRKRFGIIRSEHHPEIFEIRDLVEDPEKAELATAG